MKKIALLVFIGLLFNSCGNNNSVDRPYIISQAQEDPQEVD